MKKCNTHGFTILELMIATTVFSSILLLCTYGLIQVGNNFYKGANTVRTQKVAREIMESITQDIQFGSSEPSSDIELQRPTAANLDPNGTFCIGNNQYRYSAKKVSSGVHGLQVKGKEISCNLSTDFTTSRELLGENMRLTKFSIKKNTSFNDYSISIKVTAGDDDLFDKSNTTKYGNCLGGSGRQFCASSELNTTVRRRL